MKQPIRINKRVAVVFVTAAAIVVATGLLESGRSRGQAANANAPRKSGANSNTSPSEATVDLSSSQLNSIKIEPVGSYLFPVETETVGNISFADDLSVQVFPPFQGKLIKGFVELGDNVQKGQALYTIDSPDLIQAESTLIGAAATYELTSKALARAKDLYTTNVGVPQKELEQAISDQQTAEGALKAARDAVRVFGKSEAEIDQIIATRKIDPALGRTQSDSRPDHVVERTAGAIGTAGECPGALHGHGRLSQMDAGECRRKRRFTFSHRTAGSGKGDGLPGSRVSRPDFQNLRGG